MNSSGTDLSLKSSAYILNTQILYPYSYSSLHRPLISKAFEKAPDEYLSYLTDIYNRSIKEVVPEGIKTNVLFLPETAYVLMWRLQSATNGQSIYQNISPIADKIGEKIFDEKLSIFNEPSDDSLPGARSFDDEGIPCRRFPLIEKGVLKNFYYDLYFAQKLKTPPTGHGFKSSLSSKPVPSINHLSISPGDTSFSGLRRSIDKGIIIAGALGAHSGNIPNGDFLSAYHLDSISKGNCRACEDAMAAGNIYDILKNIVERKYAPSMFRGISVTLI
jgi:PmbA protein